MTLLCLSFHNSFLVGTDHQETGKALIENKTEFPEECIPALESDPGSPDANLTGLSKIAVEQSASKLVETLNFVDNLVKNETDCLTLGFLVFCPDAYNTSVHQIQDGVQAFDQLKYDKPYPSFDAVNKAVIECNNQGLKLLTKVNTAKLVYSYQGLQ